MLLQLPNLFIPKHKYFGLAIGRSSLRGLELTSSGKVRLMVEMGFPREVFSAGILVKKDILIDSLKKLYIAGKFTTPYVAVSFSEVYAYSREYAIPKISKEEIHEAVSWHVKDLFPFPADDLYFDWKIIETNETEYKLAVVAVQKKVLDPLVGALKEVGLKPLSFEPGASAIARLLLLKPGEHALVTEINKRGAYVTLVEGEKSIFTTVVNYTQTDTIDIYLGNICQTISEISQYYIDKGIIKAEEQLQIILTGELANSELASKIDSCSKYKSKLLSVITNNPAFNKAYAVAAGKIAPPMDPETINLLPNDLQTFYDQERKAIFLKGLLARVSISMLVVFLISLFAFLAVSNLRINLDNRVKFLTNATKTEEGKTQNLLLLNAQAKDIVALAPMRKTPKDELLAILKLVNDKIIITGWDYDDAKLTFSLSGTAVSREELLNFRDQLEASEVFIKVMLPLGSLETPENVRFTITFVTKE